MLPNKARPFVAWAAHLGQTCAKLLVYAKKFQETSISIGNSGLGSSEVKLTSPILTPSKHIPTISPNIGVFHPHQ